MTLGSSERPCGTGSLKRAVKREIGNVGAVTSPTEATMSWHLSGTYVESCNCESACPCVFLSDPTHDDCTVLIGWHVERGTHGELTLDGYNVAMAVEVEGNMATTPWRGALYVDERADAEQAAVLTSIFAGQDGGHPARLASHVGEVLGVHRVPVGFEAVDGTRRLRVGDVGHLEVQAMTGQDGGHVTIEGHPLAIAPGHPAVAASSERLEYRDHGRAWSLSDRTAFFSPFTYTA